MKISLHQAAFLFFCLIASAHLSAQQTNTTLDWMENKQNFHLPVQTNNSFQKQNIWPLVNSKIIYTLPVVVHVITTGDAVGSPDNPTNANINAMLKTLNNAFAKKGVNYGGAKMNIRFQLAVRSPTNTSTTGIIRVSGAGVSNYVSGGITNINYSGSANEVTVKSLSLWPNTDYINIWIVNKINGSSTNPGGYTYFPQYNSALTDGLVLNASVVNGANKTVVHEMGHFFNLYHTFYDGGNETTCAANDDCTTEGDQVCDTEPMLNVACGASTNSCNNNLPFIIADTIKHYTVLNNFMTYTNCQWMFTQGQVTRARSALTTYRYGLITSKALIAPDGVFPTTACIPTAENGLSPYYGIERVQFNTLNVYSNTSQADGNFYIDRTCNQSTTVTQGKAYTITITGSYGNPHRIKVFIDYNNDGDFDDENETLFSVYSDTAKKRITIPVSGVITGVALRMRVVADNPSKTPTACKLHGTSADGVGEIEDYSVIISPASFTNVQPAKISNSKKIILAQE